MFLINSRLGLFTAAHFHEHPFSRSYGVILPSSLTRVRSLTLEFSSQLPVSVCGTGSITLASGFSWQYEYRSSGFALRIMTYLTLIPDLPGMTACHLHALFQSCDSILLLRHHFTHSCYTGTGISTCCPSPTLFASA